MAHAALILAAGGSQRLGRSKQLLTQHGETLLHKTIKLALATQPQSLWLITGADHEVVSATIVDLPVQVVHNAEWSTGLASSLQTGARALQKHEGNVLLLVCDQLHLTLTHLQKLLALAQQFPDHNIASEYAGTIGIPALVTHQTLQAVSALTGDCGLKPLLLAQPNLLQRLPAEELVFDIDTPSELAEAIVQGWLDDPRQK